MVSCSGFSSVTLLGNKLMPQNKLSNSCVYFLHLCLCVFICMYMDACIPQCVCGGEDKLGNRLAYHVGSGEMASAFSQYFTVLFLGS